MNKILLALGNVKHNGEMLAKGSLFFGDVVELGSLIEAGLLKVIDASTLEEAAAIVKADVEAAAEKAGIAAEAARPKDVWAPKPNATADTTQKSDTTDTTQTEETTTDTTEKPEVGTGDLPPAGDNL